MACAFHTGARAAQLVGAGGAHVLTQGGFCVHSTHFNSLPNSWGRCYHFILRTRTRRPRDIKVPLQEAQNPAALPLAARGWQSEGLAGGVLRAACACSPAMEERLTQAPQELGAGQDLGQS